jgi:ribonuclease HIII
MKKTLNENKLHSRNHELIFDMLDKDISRCREFFIDQFSDKKEIYDFAKDWTENGRDK